MKAGINQEKCIVELKNEKDLLVQTCNLLKEKIKEQREFNKITLEDKLNLQNKILDHETRIKKIEERMSL